MTIAGHGIANPSRPGRSPTRDTRKGDAMSKPIVSPWVDWSPWAVKGDRRIVASERAWRRPLAKCGCELPHRIRVVPDLFEDWQGPLRRSVTGIEHDICICHECGEWMLYIQHECKCQNDRLPRKLTLADVRRRVFGLIDATPGVDWLVSTAWPENIGKMLPRARVRDINENPELCENITFTPRPNLWLGARISTQAEADERIPHLLRLPAARRWLDVEPTEGIDLLRVDAEGFGGPKGHKIDCIRKGFWSGGPLGFVNHSDMHDTFGPLAWVRIAADAHPDAAKSLVEQCRAAGVPCWHEGDENVREMPEPPTKGAMTP